MRLNNLIKSKGNSQKRKRLGQGRGSGHGKTCGRGHKGQKSRSGSSLRPGFESGHIPLYRRLPRRGFNNANFRTVYAIVNLSELARLEEVEVVDREVLIQAGLVPKKANLIKILGQGEIEKPLKIRADKFSASAVKKIQSAGGTIIETTPVEAAAEAAES